MNTYPAKLLLFGEYTILKGSKALAVPLPNFGGSWRFAPKGAGKQQGLAAFAAYLGSSTAAEAAQADIDVKEMKAALAKGLYFSSAIPMGYGAGSSGALCAAVYERFSRSPLPQDEPQHYPQLKALFAWMEGFFHGASSGADPLVSYLRRAVLLRPDGQVSGAALPDLTGAPFVFFLLDTGTPRQTGPLVGLFQQKCQTAAYMQQVQARLMPQTDAAIGALLGGKWMQLFAHLHQISSFQYEHFQEMVPPPFHAFWQEGLDSNDYKLKLCGAGGGGFILGMAKPDSVPLGALVIR